ncbi:uncharacterized protein LOC126599088 [Malus sylvestris]|uniref:uncharacterized protein LOC126599088 n=1 Tax=Malus sylvestris TaxID=3752 RepID=UPI0021AC0BF6|nr:uncharacterized protein LOC126599088 [Malus sylvestris]
MTAYNSIVSANERQDNAIFFVDGPGGTRKTYLYRALLATLRSNGHIILAIATSGIAATILPGGRTSHSRFKIPLSPDASSTCSISIQSDLAELIRKTLAVVWDEAPMAHKFAFETLDQTFKDIIGVDLPFGGKVMIFGRDFRQVLPVVPKGTRSELMQASMINASFWGHVKIIRLKHNMRSINDQDFSEFLLHVGNGEQETMIDDMMQLPSCMVIPWKGEESIVQFVNEVFPDLECHVCDSRYLVERAIITPKNEDADKLNKMIIDKFPGTEHILYSFDSVEDDVRNLYQQEFLNSISPGGMPPLSVNFEKRCPNNAFEKYRSEDGVVQWQVHGAKTEFESGLARKDDGVSQNDFIGVGVSERTREHDFGFFFTGFEMGIPSLSPSMSSQALISSGSSRGSDDLIAALLLSSTPSLIGYGPFST